jgi:hypothetical protein
LVNQSINQSITSTAIWTQAAFHTTHTALQLYRAYFVLLYCLTRTQVVTATLNHTQTHHISQITNTCHPLATNRLRNRQQLLSCGPQIISQSHTSELATVTTSKLNINQGKHPLFLNTAGSFDDNYYQIKPNGFQGASALEFVDTVCSALPTVVPVATAAAAADAESAPAMDILVGACGVAGLFTGAGVDICAEENGSYL